MATTCSIIIPVYNHLELTRRCIETLLQQELPLDSEIVVVDDASDPPAVSALGDLVSRLRIIRRDCNGGFAVATNDGVASTASPLAILLNNDTLPRPGWLGSLLDYADRHPRAGVVGSKLLFPDGTVQHAGVTICQDRYPRHIYAGFPADHPAVNKARRYQAVSAACALVRRDAFEAAGGFDTEFQNGYEDVDLCLRLADMGFEIHYCPNSVVQHLESATRGDRPPSLAHNDSLYRERWMQRVAPDDVQFYMEDSLLGFGFGPGETYPARLKLSPLLAVLEEESADELARLLNIRSRQVFELLKENIRLSALLLDAGITDRSTIPTKSTQE